MKVQMRMIDVQKNKNVQAKPIREQYRDTVRQRIMDQHGELGPAPGEPSIIALSVDVLPCVGSY